TNHLLPSIKNDLLCPLYSKRPLVTPPLSSASRTASCTASRAAFRIRRPLLLAVAVPYNRFQGFSIALGNTVSPASLRLNFPLQMQPPNFNLHFVRQSVKDQYSIESIEDLRTHL